MLEITLAGSSCAIACEQTRPTLTRQPEIARPPPPSIKYSQSLRPDGDHASWLPAHFLAVEPTWRTASSRHLSTHHATTPSARSALARLTHLPQVSPHLADKWDHLGLQRLHVRHITDSFRDNFPCR